MKTFFKAKTFLIAAVAIAAVAFVASRDFVSVKAAGTGSVVAVPWMGSEALFHEVTSGSTFVLQAVGTDVNGNALTGISSATWDAGNGSVGAASMPLGNGLAIERTVTYTGSAGQPFTATVTVTMTNGDVYTDTMNIRIAANSREARVNMAIDKALWYLHKRLTRTTADGKTAGYWSNTCCSTINNQLAGTAPAVQAFEINNHRESGDRLKDPYVDDVKYGLRFILSATTGVGTNAILRSRAKVMQGTNNPDGNNNNRVLNSSDNDHSIYLGGQVMDALVASGTPNKIADVGEATWVNGQTYATIVQDLIDGYSQGQNDDKGGWLYVPNDGLVGGNQSFDISSSHWWGAGVLAAQGWNMDAPVWVKTQLKNNGFPNAHTTTAGGEAHAPAAGECHWHYRGDNSDSSWDNYMNLTPAGLILMNAAGLPKTDAQWKCTEKWIANRFASTKGNPYSMYQTTKGMRTAFDATGAPAPVTLLNGTIDWYAEYADYIVAAQAATGQINYNNGSTAASQIQGDMQTAWNVIILSPSLFELPPSASCTASPATIGKFGGTVSFSAAASFHPDATATITGYSWNFGDASAPATGVTTSHNYAIPASFPTTRSATVTVTDSNGNSATASCPVTIVNNNVPPAVSIAGPYTVCAGSPITLTATATDEDGTIGSSEWDLNAPINFASIDATGLSYDATAFFAAKAPGLYNIGFRAADNDTASSSAFSTVTVVAANDPSCNQPPVVIVPANIVKEATSPSGAFATFTATATDDHDTLTPVCTPASGSTFGINPTTSLVTTVNCSATDLNGLSANGSFTVTVQDTTPPVITTPGNISIHAMSAAGATYNFSPTGTDIVDVTTIVTCDRPSGFLFPMGPTVVTCTSTDKHNNTATTAFTVDVKNAAPVAVNDAVTTHGPININVLANDSDADGDALTVSIPGGPGTANGTVFVQADKTIRYLPNGFQSNNDSFTYQISDGRGGFSTATVSITVTNAAPVALNDTITLAHNQSTAVIPVMTNDSDPEGDTFTVHQVTVGPNCHCSPFSINADGTVTYTSIPNQPNTFSSPAQFTYVIRDQYGKTSAPATVTVIFPNEKPVATPVFVTTHGAPVTVNVLAASSDPDGDTLSLVGACGGMLPPQVGFCSFNGAAGTLTFTPNPQWFGPQIQLGYTVNDGHTGVASSFVRVSYVNQLPVAGHPTFTTSVNTPLPINEAMLLAGSSDPDGDSLSVDNVQQPAHGTIAQTSEDAGAYTPNPGFIGVDTFTYQVDDDHGGLVSTTATITVTAPTTTTVSAPTVVFGTPQVITVTIGSGASTAPTGVVTIEVGGSSYSGVLANGIATFVVNQHVGIHAVTATYNGENFYLGSTGTGALQVTPAPSTTVVVCTPTVTFNATAHEVCTASYTTTDGLGGSLPVTYTNNVNVGQATATASYAGDADHSPSDGSATFQITPASSTTVVVCAPATTVYNGFAQALCTATVTGVGGLNQALPVTYAANTNVGTATGSATFAGDSNHDGSSSSATFEITKAAPACSVTPYSVTYDTAAHTATGSCTGVRAESLAGLDLTGTTHTAAGTYTDSWTFTDVTGNYSNTGGSVTDAIAKAPTKTTLVVSSPVALAGAPVTLTATVVSVLPGAGTPDGTVTFREGATVLGTSTLNASGVATLTTTTLSNGPHTITATYNESANFLSSTSNTVSTLIYGFAAGGGTFVIADTAATMGATVNFWGAQWEKNNIPTGGKSNASFKGFAITPAVPTVGATFTSAPGNSAPQPSSVPQYIGIIVTSKVTKSGSNITGTIVKLVVVKVTAGYVADPGHAGTGTIVAFIQ